MTKQELMQKLLTINGVVNEIVNKIDYIECEQINISDADLKNADDIFMSNEVARILDVLIDVQGNIEYLSKPIKLEGKLFRNTYGKYEIENTEKWYSSGCIIEYLCENDYPCWKKSSIEYNGVDYYIVADNDIDLNGLLVRTRGF
ncbi:MAG: DUF5348 domain-containing protein [Clostridia bacterium]